jgi:hypothetical protein
MLNPVSHVLESGQQARQHYAAQGDWLAAAAAAGEHKWWWRRWICRWWHHHPSVTAAAVHRRRRSGSRCTGALYPRLLHVQVTRVIHPASRRIALTLLLPLPLFQRRRRSLRSCHCLTAPAAPLPPLRQGHRSSPQSTSPSPYNSCAYTHCTHIILRYAFVTPCAASVCAAVDGALRPCTAREAGSWRDFHDHVTHVSHALSCRQQQRLGPPFSPRKRSKRPPPLLLAPNCSQRCAMQPASRPPLPSNAVCARNVSQKSLLSEVCITYTSHQLVTQRHASSLRRHRVRSGSTGCLVCRG